MVDLANYGVSGEYGVNSRKSGFWVNLTDLVNLEDLVNLMIW